MHAHSYDYAVIRVVPRVDRDERMNAGVIMVCAASEWLLARIELDQARLLALDPTADVESIRTHLNSIPAICRGGSELGPIGRLPLRARFDWLVAPRSTVIQMSPVHTGCCADLDATLEHLLNVLVRPPRTGLTPSPMRQSERR